ncbi:C-type lectin lectoxin-Lio3-like [Haliotis cracherodii]|uniref:C-type lectin lectoxin-Lio3-like n=1 Tax=Haliotis cracherodii TaxID=6455 RepID=UPI0039ED44A9
MYSSVMYWFIYTLISFTFISKSSQTAPITKRKFLFRHAHFDGRLVQNWTDVRTTSSVWECADICAADSNCMSVCFKPTSQDLECVMYERMVSTTDAFTLFPSATVFALCPSGYSGVGRRCIKVVTQKMNMDSARAHCKDDNADLIHLGSQARIDEFRYFMEANGDEPDNSFYWCGASHVNGLWQWISGMTFSSNSDLWCPHEPSNPSEECTATKAPAFICLYDLHCYSDQKFVCEIQF